MFVSTPGSESLSDDSVVDPHDSAVFTSIESEDGKKHPFFPLQAVQKEIYCLKHLS